MSIHVNAPISGQQLLPCNTRSMARSTSGKMINGVAKNGWAQLAYSKKALKV